MTGDVCRRVGLVFLLAVCAVLLGSLVSRVWIAIPSGRDVDRFIDGAACVREVEADNEGEADRERRLDLCYTISD